MSILINRIKEYYKIIIGIGLIIFSLPVIEVLIKIIFTYGAFIGTLVRGIIEKGVCF